MLVAAGGHDIYNGQDQTAVNSLTVEEFKIRVKYG
jgi:hypothetical protein